MASRVLEPPERVLLSACLSVAGSGNFFFSETRFSGHISFDIRLFVFVRAANLIISTTKETSFPFLLL